MSQAVLTGIATLVGFGAIGIGAGYLVRRYASAPRGWIAILGAMASLAGPWLVQSQVTSLQQYARLRDWKTVEGRIVDSRVVGQRAFRPQITYEYEINGRIYRDSTSLDPPSFGGRNSKLDAAEAVASVYPPGEPVVIHYDPARPVYSRMKITPPWSVYGKLGFGGLIFGVGVGLIAVSISRRGGS